MAIVLLLASAAHLSYFEKNHQFLVPDSEGYITPAKNMLAGRGFVDNLGWPETFRTPGYPLFLAAAFRTGAHIEDVVLMQHALIICLTIATFLFANRITADVKLATAASVLYALDFLTIAWSNYIVTETIYTCLMFATCWLALEASATAVARHRWILVAIASILAGTAALVRPVALFFGVALALFFFLTCKAGRAATAAVSLGAFLIAPSIWLARNYIETGTPTFSSVVGFNLLFNGAAGSIALGDQGNFEENFDKRWQQMKRLAEEEAQSRLGRNYGSLSQPEREALEARIGIKILREHPVRALWLFFRGAAIMMLGGDAQDLGRLARLPTTTCRACVGALAGMYLILSCIGLINFARAPSRTRTLGLFILLSVGYHVVVSPAGSGGAGADSRYRVPIMPLWCITTAAGLVTLTRRKLSGSDAVDRTGAEHGHPHHTDFCAAQ